MKCTLYSDSFFCEIEKRKEKFNTNTMGQTSKYLFPNDGIFLFRKDFANFLLKLISGEEVSGAGGIRMSLSEMYLWECFFQGKNKVGGSLFDT